MRHSGRLAIAGPKGYRPMPTPAALPLSYATLTGEALLAALPALAELRIGVFRDWPYLYEGDAAYEERYLRAYADSGQALVMGAWAGDRLVGAATATPMEDHADEFAAPFRAGGHDLRDILYCGESVLLPEHRGQGAGRAFFARREAHGRALGRRYACFCGVVRSPDDPRRPGDYLPLDAFWRRLGYAPMDGVTTHFAWREVGAEAESQHPMQFWIKRL
jgi:GNAT superfamily N-acetyltransferase